jgi:hypothetical protein
MDNLNRFESLKYSTEACGLVYLLFAVVPENVEGVNGLSTKTSYFLIKHERAKRMQPSSTEIVLTFSR